MNKKDRILAYLYSFLILCVVLVIFYLTMPPLVFGCLAIFSTGVFGYSVYRTQKKAKE